MLTMLIQFSLVFSIKHAAYANLIKLIKLQFQCYRIIIGGQLGTRVHCKISTGLYYASFPLNP